MLNFVSIVFTEKRRGDADDVGLNVHSAEIRQLL